MRETLNRIIIFQKQFTSTNGSILLDSFFLLAAVCASFFGPYFIDSAFHSIVLVAGIAFSLANKIRIEQNQVFRYFKALNDRQLSRDILLNLLVNCSPFLIFMFVSLNIFYLTINVVFLLVISKIIVSEVDFKKIRVKTEIYQISTFEIFSNHAKKIFIALLAGVLYSQKFYSLGTTIFSLNYLLSIEYKNCIYLVRALDKEKYYLKNIVINKNEKSIRATVMFYALEMLNFLFVFTLLNTILQVNLIDIKLGFFIITINFWLDFWLGSIVAKKEKSKSDLVKNKFLSGYIPMKLILGIIVNFLIMI